MRAVDRHDARVFTVLESRNLRGPRKAGADDADANFVCHVSPSRFPAVCFLPTGFHFESAAVKVTYYV